MTDPVLRAVIGLGNPGDRYAPTRHNAGYWFADRLAARHGGVFRKQARFHGLLAEISVAGQKLLVLKPETFMNDSGRAVSALAGFHKMTPQQLLVAHDELDHPAGTVRLKLGGGHGGHNGLRDVHAGIGAEYRRLRIGIGHPGSKDEVLDYVLKKPGKQDSGLIEEAIEAAVDAVTVMLQDSWDKGVQQLHSRDPDGN